MGLTEKGYIRRTFDDILNDKVSKAKELFGEDIDTSELTPLGKFIRIGAYDQALLEEELENVYYSAFPNTASGQSLDRLLVFAGISRNTATAASYTVKLTGTAGYTVPIGFLVGTETGIMFYTATDATIGEDGTCEVDVVCTEDGTIGNIVASTIDSIINPDVDVVEVVGVRLISVGSDEESDAELRERFSLAIKGSGSCNSNAIRAALLRVPTVEYAEVIANDSAAADAEGRPPYSFECYVSGGNDYHQEIAETIFEKKPVGIKTTGDVGVEVFDDGGNAHMVYFSTALNVPVKVKVQIKTDNTFGENGGEQIKENISTFIDAVGIGKTLVLSTLYAQIYSVTGVVEATSLQLSTNGGTSYSSANVSVPKYGVVVCDGVEVEVVS